jgi:tRNA(fMet)-specific endonuclease VapC
VGVLIDTSIPVEAEGGRLDLDSHFSEAAAGDGFVSVVTVSEVLHGFHRAVDPAIAPRRRDFR